MLTLPRWLNSSSSAQNQNSIRQGLTQRLQNFLRGIRPSQGAAPRNPQATAGAQRGSPLTQRGQTVAVVIEDQNVLHTVSLILKSIGDDLANLNQLIKGISKNLGPHRELDKKILIEINANAACLSVLPDIKPECFFELMPLLNDIAKAKDSYLKTRISDAANIKYQTTTLKQLIECQDFLEVSIKSQQINAIDNIGDIAINIIKSLKKLQELHPPENRTPA